MRALYFIVSTILILSILLFISSFIYLDKEKHRIFYYTVNLDGHDVGTIRLDKFTTEDKIIYKSVTNVPLFPVFTELRSRTTLDKRYALENHIRERYASGVTETVVVENVKNSASFISIFKAGFACLENMPINKGSFVFEESSPATYLPLIENYDFKRGRSQGFNTLTCSSDSSLPPMKRFVILTSIKDEHLKIDNRKIKTENLILRIRNYPQGSVWVAKSDRSLIMLEMPKIGLKITRRFSPKTLGCKEYSLQSNDYVQKSATFKNKGVQLSGTLNVSKEEGARPAVLLIWGSGPQDRQYQGFFTSVADYLAKNGFCIMSFDKRGVGLSGGNYASSTDSDHIEDIGAAVEYLAGQKEVDPKRIAVIGHGRGAFYAIKIAASKDIVKGLVLMAPSFGLSSDIEMLEKIKMMASKNKWNEEYLKTVMRSMQETAEKVRGAKHNWIYVSGKKCFIKNMREAMAEKPMDTVKKLSLPTLTLQGKEDEEVPSDTASRIEGALTEAANPKHILTYYSYLGHFFGKRINDGICRIHYEVQGEVLETVKNWLNDNLSGQK